MQITFYLDVIENDIDLEKNINKIWAFSKTEGYDQDQVNIQRSFKNNFKVSNEYNLRSFPFDKQNIKFRLVDGAYSLKTELYEIRKLIEENGGIDMAKQKIKDLSDQAISDLNIFSDSVYKDALISALEYNYNRNR